MDALEDRLEDEPAVKKPLRSNQAGRGIALFALADGVTQQEILSLIDRLNGSGLVKYASPLFTAPSTRAVLTDEMVVKFKQGYAASEIEAFIAARSARRGAASA